MSYELVFDWRALKEWRKLDQTLRKQFKTKLADVLVEPHIAKNKLRELPDCYKIKLRSSGYRLIYQVQQRQLVVFIVAVGKRNRGQAYSTAGKRLDCR